MIHCFEIHVVFVAVSVVVAAAVGDYSDYYYLYSDSNSYLDSPVVAVAAVAAVAAAAAAAAAASASAAVDIQHVLPS